MKAGVCALLVAAAAPLGVVHAATLTVCVHGCAYTTIQAAVNAARSGDTVSIAAGTYFENVTITGKALTLVGAGEDYTTVDGRYLAPVFVLGHLSAQATTANSITLSKMTITHGASYSGVGGGGISVRGALLHLDNSIVTSNSSAGSGGGIEIFPTPNVSNIHAQGHYIISSMITHNRSQGNGGGLHVDQNVEEFEIYDSTIARNTSSACGGGLAVENNGFVGTTNTNFTDNSAATDGGGICVAGGEGFTIVSFNYGALSGNHAGRDGGGASALGQIGLQSATVSLNAAGRDGGGIAAKGNGQIFFDGGDFVVLNNAGGTGGGIFDETPLQGVLNDPVLSPNFPNACVDATGGCP